MRQARVGALAILLFTPLACDGPLGPEDASPDVAQPVLDAAASVPAATILSGEGLDAVLVRSAFEAAASDLVVEDFEDAVTETAVTCPGAFDHTTDNDCFAPGAIVEGVTIRALKWDRMSVLRPGIAGVTSTVVGPASWPDTTEITFTGGEVYAVGLELLAPNGGPAPVDIELYDPADEPIGTAVAQTGVTTGVFWGVVSETPIGRVVLAPGPDVGLLFDDLMFTSGPVNDAAASVADVPVDVRQSVVNPWSRGSIPVAVLSTDAFDATRIDPATVRFGPDEAAAARGPVHGGDFDGDGLPDLLFHFPAPDAGLQCGDEDARLFGETLDGTSFEGTGEVRVLCVPNPTGRIARPT